MSKIYTIKNGELAHLDNIIERHGRDVEMPRDDKFVLRLWNSVNAEKNMYGGTIDPGYPRHMTWLVKKSSKNESGLEVIENHWFDWTREGRKEADDMAIKIANREKIGIYC